jgi:hypothetical protein
MGRWSYQTLVGKRNSKITIITGYRCVRNTSGDSSAWTLQSIFMKDQQSKTDPNPWKQFITDLIVFINQKQSQNHEIILNLDANEALGEESQGIAKLMRECNLVDLHDIPEMEPEQQLQDTYRQGDKRWIDFMLGTPWIQTCVQRQGALEYNDGIVSDHCGMYVNLDAVSLFGGATDDQVAASSRGFTSKNEKKTKKYLDELDKYFLDHKIDSQIDLLMEDAPCITRNQLKCQYEGINIDISHGMLASERKVRPYQTFKYEWSPELDKARYCLRYWRVRYSDVKNNSTSHKALASCFTT